MLLNKTKFPVWLIAFFLPVWGIAKTEILKENDILTEIFIQDSLPADTIPKVLEVSDEFKSKVKYTARDSIRFEVNERKVYLYGDASIAYEKMTLKAGHIVIDWESHTVNAEGLKDSTGTVRGNPEFSENNESFTSKSIKYNFDTKKGRITSVVTREGEGFIHGETVKKEGSDEFFIKRGIYTTCELDTPHYFIAADKLKVIPKDKVITGPAYLVIEKIPTPFAIPFGYFPNKKGQASGIIIPSYGESDNLGFFLKNGGYYFGLSEYFDLALRGDIYSKGSWGSNVLTSYSRRYKYAGSLQLNFNVIKSGEKELPDYSENRDFFVRWNHSQDPKARPNSLFSASVNAGSSTFFRNSISNTNDFLTNTFQSAISWSKSWTGKPYNLAVSARHNQNTFNKEINLNLPDATFTVNRRNPFKSKIQSGEQKWFEKIGYNYVGTLQNNLRTTDSTIFTRESLSDFQNGMRHNIPVSTSIKLLKHFALSPSVNMTSRWYLQSIRKRWNADLGTIETDTIQGFRDASDVSLSASLSTRIYGMLQFKRGGLRALRHVITPNVSFSYYPDFLAKKYGYYKYVQSNAAGDSIQYNIFETGIFGSPGPKSSGVVGINLDNILEMKVRSIKDTLTGMKKIKLFENFGISTSYNTAADSMRWSMISINGRTTLFGKIFLNFTGNLDPYVFDSLAGNRINKFEFDVNKRIGRLTNASLALSFSFNPAAVQPKVSPKGTEEEIRMINRNPEAYVDFNIPWNLNVNYNVFYDNQPFSASRVTQTLSFSGDVNLTPKWKIGFNSGYDFVQKDFSYSSISIYRDLHCWEMHFNWIPFGFRQSYNFQINVKSSVLQDLKLVRRRDWVDNF